ncbi:MAG: hypothetical protein IT378_21030 [Sandaracinaceae bacterium]|nr:hypothetical protein [Sandaracinaceae bacterium]
MSEPRIALVALLALAAPLALAGCGGDPTELVVVVDTDLVVPSELDRVLVTVVGPSGSMASASETLTDCSALPLTIGVRPRGQSLGPVRVTVVGSGGAGSVTREATTTLVRGRATMLVMHILRFCEGVACGAGATCGEVGCASTERDPLPDWTGVVPARIGTCSTDAGLLDASVLDADGDGVPAATDCDDSDSAIGTTATRACANACAIGNETCNMGMWGACTAPVCTCDSAEENMTRNVRCALCGTQAQRCLSGAWTDEGDCTGQGTCEAGTRDPSGGASCTCGTMERTCDATCMWPDWSCVVPAGACMAGATDTDRMGCGGACQERTRTCEPSCRWGDWGAWGACTSGAGCTAGTMETDPNHPPCGMCGTETRTRTCDASCAWGDWSTPSCDGQHGSCTAGMERRTRRVGCGRCGTAQRYQTCGNDCEWGPEWEDGCEGEHGSCDEGDTMDGTRPCGACNEGSIPTRATCNSSCEWDPTVDTGTCSGTGCTPGDTRNCTGVGSCGSMTLYSFDYCNPSTCQWQTGVMNCGRCGY